MSKNFEDPLTEYLVLQIKLDIDVHANADDSHEPVLNPSSHQQMRRRRKRKNSATVEHTQLSSYNQSKHIPEIPDRRASSYRVLEQDKPLQLYADWLTRCDQIGEALDVYAFVASHYTDRCIPLAQLKALSSTVIDYISSASATAAKTASLPPSPLPPSVRRVPLPTSSSSRSANDGYAIGGGAAAVEPSLNANAISCDRLQDRVKYSKNKRIQRYWKDGGGGGGGVGGGGFGTVGLCDDDHARFCDALLSDPCEVDPLLCPICKDILRCPVTANCGHSFCRDCCDSSPMCPICRVKFPSSCPPVAAAATAASLSSEFATPSSGALANLSIAGFYNSNSNTVASQYMDFASAAVTDRGGVLVPEIDNTNASALLRNHATNGGINNDNHSVSSHSSSNSMKFMPDVLVRRLVEKWWGADLQAKTINERAASFMSLNLLDDALTFCNASLENHPNNFSSLLLRAEVLRRLSHYQSSLADIDHALRIKSSSAKAHYHRSLALCGLGRFDEALVAQCVAISLDDKNSTLSSTELFQHDLAKLLQKLLAQYPKKIHLNSSVASTPYDVSPESRRRRKQIGLLNGFDGENSIHVADCDLLRQGSRKHCRRKSYGRKQKQEVQVDLFGSARFECILERAQQEVQRIRDSQSDEDREQQHLIPVNPSLIDPSDFDCVLCCRTLWKPVVTPCGHTYCWVCLDRSMYYSPSCPLCMSPLVEQHVKVLQGSSSPVPFMLAKRPVTKFLEAAMKRFIPERYEKRFRQEMNQESSVPLFICTTAFPHVPCPLFVYEPRYRLMVRRAVESGKKQFGIVQSQSGKSRYFDVGTILDIRDCVLLGDGCSILSTIGCKRFRILARNEKDGYDTAKVEYIYDEIITEDNVSFISSMHASVLSKAIEWYKSLGTELKEEILRSFGEMPAVEENWESIADGPAWAWWIIALLPLNQQLKVDILATTSLEKRLRAIEKTLDCMSGNFKRSHQSCVVVHREGIQPCQAVECCQRSSSELSSSSDSHTTSEHSQLML